MDWKGVGKFSIFSSDEIPFARWQKKLRNDVAAALPGAREMMDWAGDQLHRGRPIARGELEDKVSAKLALFDRVEENLNSNLSSFTDGEAFSIESNHRGSTT